MLRFLSSFTAFFLFVTQSRAAEQRRTGDALEALLPTIIATGNGTRQTFSKSGATTYNNNGRNTFGTWRVDRNQYCSQWPPSKEWACYVVLRDVESGDIIWLDQEGNRTVNTVTLKQP